ncbi:MAG: GyrI-like domain-containing protein [Methanobacteriaceae archaeon]|nr:GyrI-like domain-containing protein [Methanobacteriaceae archaeon]MDP2837004.1 GyrI-like domain-containing protein [Methanobacteriaceae archaeon]MDP3034824.1 GyrI-like domain-containing protein [Methanobacteriaceae archaeon]MDP3485804.1 GyrI-like domain-containing protein [Methanobacteriaceae archaeon]MDP3624447.1 GyrI-like domain-containing protein [Methanobacteriaceae archaeon]
MKIEKKTVPEHQVAFIYQIGSYDKIPSCLGVLIEWLVKNGLEPKYPVYGMYYNSPLEVTPSELEWEVGAGFEGKIDEENPKNLNNQEVHLQTISEHQVVSTVFKGPCGESSSVYVDLYEYTIQNNLKIVGPVKEIYLNSPEMASAEELLTEVQFPVI